MKQRGRKATTPTAVIIEGAFGSTRPEPPDDLTPAQAKIWRSIVATEDPNFFSTGALRELLADYCRRRDAANTINKVIDGFKPEWIKSDAGAHRYKDLLQLRDLEVRGTTSLATKLRLTNQSRYTTQSAATAARNALGRVLKPWEL